MAPKILMLFLASSLPGACADDGDATRDVQGDVTLDMVGEGISLDSADAVDDAADGVDEFEFRRQLAERCQGAPELGGQTCGCPDTSVVTFEDVRFDCLLCGLMRCSDIRGGFVQSFGATFISGVRYATDMCYYRVVAEVEGGVTVYDCASYPGFAPWPALLDSDRFPGIGDRPYCTIASQCSLLDPDEPCPSDLLMCGG